MPQIRLLSLDPDYKHTGLCVFEREFEWREEEPLPGDGLELVRHEVVEASTPEIMLERVREVVYGTEARYVVTEQVYAGPNRQTTIKLGHLQGFIHASVVAYDSYWGEMDWLPPVSVAEWCKIGHFATKREIRKQMAPIRAQEITGEEFGDHEADAFFIGLAAIARLSDEAGEP